MTEKKTKLLFASKSYSKIICVVAWMLSFAQKPKTNIFNSDFLQSHELENVFIRIVFSIKKQHFQDDIDQALKNKDYKGSLKCRNSFINL